MGLTGIRKTHLPGITHLFSEEVKEKSSGVVSRILVTGKRRCDSITVYFKIFVLTVAFQTNVISCILRKGDICIEGPGGVGKSTSMKHLSLAWANSESPELQQFHLLFHVALKSVKQGQSLSEAIVAQHKRLKGRKVASGEIEELIEGETDVKVLLLLDGLDEYTQGSCVDLEEAVSRDSLPECCILVTSRDTLDLALVRPHMDVEAEITGFDPERVEEYITKYLGSQEKCKKLLEHTVSRNLLSGDSDDYGILHIPILLHMVCVLFMSNVSLPKTITGIYEAIVERCLDWEEIRRSGKKTEADMKTALEAALVGLGKLCWERLKWNNASLVFTKVSCQGQISRSQLDTSCGANTDQKTIIFFPLGNRNFECIQTCLV